jgi:multisubunit Na+/H+ antiporter MnhC subunit
MNLLLRPLDNPSDPVWSVIILTIIAVGLALGYVIYILRIAFAELKDGRSNQPEGCEPGPADSTPDTQD